MSLFQEYLNSKDKITPPVVDPTGDQIDPKTSPVAPPKGGKKYKTSDGKPRTKANTGWAEQGDKKLIYKPGVTSANGAKPAKIPTAEQVKMAQAFTSDVSRDLSLLETVVKEMRRTGLLGALIAEIFDHKDSFAYLAEIMCDETYGPRAVRNLTNAMNEEVAGSYADELENDGGEEDHTGDDDDSDNDPFKDEESSDDDDEDSDDEEGGEPDPNENPDEAGGAPPMDPSAGGMDPSMMGGMDPSMGGGMGMDPSMMGGGMPPQMGGGMGMDMDPSMMGGGMPPQMGGMPPMGGGMPQMPLPPQSITPQMMRNFQRIMMRAYQRSMMRKQ